MREEVNKSAECDMLENYMIRERNSSAIWLASLTGRLSVFFYKHLHSSHAVYDRKLPGISRFDPRDAINTYTHFKFSLRIDQPVLCSRSCRLNGTREADVFFTVSFFNFCFFTWISIDGLYYPDYFVARTGKLIRGKGRGYPACREVPEGEHRMRTYINDGY